MTGEGANGQMESPKRSQPAQTRHSLSGRLGDAFPHDSATCSRRVVESRRGILPGAKYFRGAALIPREVGDG
jgi:hypothetical protein